jgi:hypothetical protein
MKRPDPNPARCPSAVAKPLSISVRPRDRQPGGSIVPLRSGPLQKLAWIFGIWL